MDDLPELPFERVLSYLSLEDRIKSRAVSRSWRMKFDFKVKSLCCSERPRQLVWMKGRWVSDAFAQNFISSPRFEVFINTFAQSILCNLKHLRLCYFCLSVENSTAFAQGLRSFDQLEELDIIGLNRSLAFSKLQAKFELTLSLSTLNRIHLEDLGGIERLTLDAPRLQKVELSNCSSPLSLNIVHAKSVETLITSNAQLVKQMKNLKYLYCDYCLIDSTFLSDLEQLKEIHLVSRVNLPALSLFEQKQQYDRADLKIFHFGLLLNDLNGPDGRVAECIRDLFGKANFVHLAENRSRLADQVPLNYKLPYVEIERVAPELAINVLKRFTDLETIVVRGPVQDIQRFLDFLKQFSNIGHLDFSGDQPQELFDRLPGHGALQKLVIRGAPPDVRFLFRLEHLIELQMLCSIDVETIRKVLEELEVLSLFEFRFNSIKVMVGKYSGQFLGLFCLLIGKKHTEGLDLNATIQFIVENAKKKKNNRPPLF